MLMKPKAKASHPKLDAETRAALRLRAEIAASISRHTDLYKICEGCESIVSIHTIFCPICNAYRFNEDGIDILQRADVLAKKIQTQLTDEDYGLT